MAKYINSTNPIKPVGLGNHVAYAYPMTRYIDYTERDWRMYSDQLINNGMAQGWDTMVTWMLASSPFIQTLIERRLNPILSARYVLMDENGDVDEALTEQIDKGWFLKWIEAASMAIFQGVFFSLKTTNWSATPSRLSTHSIEPSNIRLST